MRKLMLCVAAILYTQFSSAEPILEGWIGAMGGRDRLAAAHSTYREATIDVAGNQGSIRVWRTTDGKYRKEESIATYSLVETFDGVRGMVQRGGGQPQEMSAADLARARSTAFANASAVYFVAFPERRHGSITIESDGTIVLRPQGGIDWRVTLDPQTSLPRTMIHQEGERTITVTFAGYETVDGIKFEKEIHRSTGEPGRNAVIRFTKTLVNPPVETSLFSIPPASPTNP